MFAGTYTYCSGNAFNPSGLPPPVLACACPVQVMLTDLTDSWRARHEWSLESLARRYPDVALKVSVSGDGQKVRAGGGWASPAWLQGAARLEPAWLPLAPRC